MAQKYKETRAHVIYTPVIQRFHLRADGDAFPEAGHLSSAQCQFLNVMGLEMFLGFLQSREGSALCHAVFLCCLWVKVVFGSYFAVAARCTATSFISLILLVTSVTAEQKSKASYLDLLQDVIEAIADSAFKTSQYPVILSFENHVDT